MCIQIKKNICSKELKMSRFGNDNVQSRELYHGTREENVSGIVRSNFDWRLAGRNTEAVFGDGVYFSNSAKYAHTFAVKSAKSGVRHMFVASVLVGTEYVKGEVGMKRPPVKNTTQNNERGDLFVNDSTSEVLYDCCVDDVNEPTIFVIFDFNQIYPSYLIKYEITNE